MLRANTGETIPGHHTPRPPSARLPPHTGPTCVNLGQHPFARGLNPSRIEPDRRRASARLNAFGVRVALLNLRSDSAEGLSSPWARHDRWTGAARLTRFRRPAAIGEMHLEDREVEGSDFNSAGRRRGGSSDGHRLSCLEDGVRTSWWRLDPSGRNAEARDLSGRLLVERDPRALQLVERRHIRHFFLLTRCSSSWSRGRA